MGYKIEDSGYLWAMGRRVDNLSPTYDLLWRRLGLVGRRQL